MLLAFIFACIASVATEDQPCETCIKVDGICKNASYVIPLNAPFGKIISIKKIGIRHSDNTLFFVFVPGIVDREYYKIGYVNLSNPHLDAGTIETKTKAVNDFGTFDIGPENKIVYVGGKTGIYYLDPDNKALILNPRSRGEQIKVINVYKGSVLYLRDFQNIIVEKNCASFSYYGYMHYAEYGNVNNFVINNNNHLVFLNDTGLYVSRFKFTRVVFLSNNPFFRGLTIDLNDVVYTWWTDYIYKVVIDKKFDKSRLVKVAEIPGLGGITFDKDNNMLVTLRYNLIRLTPTSADC